MVTHNEMTQSNISRGLAVDLNVSGNLNPTDFFLEDLINWSVETCGEQEFVKAKEEFFEETGKVFYDDEMYHTRMHYFTCYFVFERTLKNAPSGLEKFTPFEAHLKHNTNPMIGGYSHSVFKVLKNHNNGLVLLDILTLEKFKIQKQDSETLKGINKGDFFQGFLLHLSNSTVLSRGLVFHPAKASNAINQKIKSFKRKSGGWTPLETVTNLAKLQLKHHRLKHVDPSRVYSE